MCRLLSLAYPNQFELTTTQEVGIDLFLETLGDPSLERRVREKELSTLDETFWYCLKLEAYDKAITLRSDRRRQPVHVARNMHEKPDSTMDAVDGQQLDKILLGQRQAEEKYVWNQIIRYLGHRCSNRIPICQRTITMSRNCIRPKKILILKMMMCLHKIQACNFLKRM